MSAEGVVSEFLTCPWCRNDLAACACYGKPGARPEANPDPNAEWLAEAFNDLAACVHCGLPLSLGGEVPGWGLHAEGSHRGKSRCGEESGQPYGLNGHTAYVSCDAPCAGTHDHRKV